MKDIELLKKRVKETISLGQLLRQDGYIKNELEEEQFSCTFHGQDNKKSARYYRSTDTAYCWVCKERWDCISYIGKREGLSFGSALKWLLKTYTIKIDDIPEATEEHVRQLESIKIQHTNKREILLERLRQALLSLRDDLDVQKYSKFVYSYMILKYVVSDEKFEEQYSLVKKGLLKLLAKMRE